MFKLPWRQNTSDNLPLKESDVQLPRKRSGISDLIMKIKAVGYVNNNTYRREKFQRCEYNLSEIRDASEADSYVKIALTKYSYMIYKAGWTLKSENQEAIDYIMYRWRLMSYQTDKPMDILFQEVADDLVRYSNAFLIKARVDKMPPTCKVKATGVDSTGRPVGGYFRVDPSSVKIKRDKHGNILKYEQGRGEEKKQWNKEDVIHIYMDKDGNNAYGTPRIIAALDDVKLLRKIEGNMVALIHRFSMPLYHWKIGIPQAGFQASDPEIQKAKREIEGSSLDGLIITNEKTEIKAIGSEGSAMNMAPYLEYLENRVFSALGVSASQMGRGGAKQDADSMEQQIHDTVKYIQRMLSKFIEHGIINELLAEGGFDIFDPKNEVQYVFEEISLETKIKKENHEMLKWQSNVTTFEEGRRRMGLRDVPEDEERLFQRMISDKSSLDQIDRNGEWQEKLAHITAASKATSSSGSSSNSTSTSKAKARNTSGKKQPNKAATNNNRPQNQHGTTSVKVKESVDSDYNTSLLYRIYYNIPELNEHNVKNYQIILFNEIERIIKTASLEAMNDAIIEINSDYDDYYCLPNLNINYSSIDKNIKDDIAYLLNHIKEESESNKDISKCLLNSSFMLDDIVSYYCQRIYNYSFIQTGKYVDINNIYIKLNNSNKFKEANVDDFTLASMFDSAYDNCVLTYDKSEVR
mgnify:FL=1